LVKDLERYLDKNGNIDMSTLPEYLREELERNGIRGELPSNNTPHAPPQDTNHLAPPPASSAKNYLDDELQKPESEELQNTLSQAHVKMELLWKKNPKLAAEATPYSDDNGMVPLSSLPAPMAKQMFDEGLVTGKKLTQVEAFSLSRIAELESNLNSVKEISENNQKMMSFDVTRLDSPRSEFSREMKENLISI
jgi:hypothetical protein